jgi:hypothetical protein
VAQRLEGRRRELQARLRTIEANQEKLREEVAHAEEEAAVDLLIGSLRAKELEDLVRRAVAVLPEPLVRRNPTLSNPFVRAKVYELAAASR